MNEMQPDLPKQHNEGYIAVRGTARIASPPDKVTFSVGVRIKKETVSEAFEANTNQINAVLEALSKAGVPDNAMETSYFNLDQVEARKNVSAGFQVTNSVRVTREATDNVGKLACGLWSLDLMGLP
jgi:uncharacterized protein YggE